jgi:hypothetical protein
MKSQFNEPKFLKVYFCFNVCNLQEDIYIVNVKTDISTDKKMLLNTAQMYQEKKFIIETQSKETSYAPKELIIFLKPC